ncbi:MAG: hypothetical protein JNJ56_01975 [Ignavibacteria bacterium]|nr:hypothetical protein [Ignavibacteria bacterium]
MKIRIILAALLLVTYSRLLKADTTYTELVVPKYIGSKTANGTNNARTPFAVCLRITGLQPNTAYDVQIGIGLITDAATSFGAGNIWNRNRNAFTGQRDTLAFTTDSNGDSGPFWSYLQPTGNSSRFNAGQIHNLRVGIAVTGGSISNDPAYIGTKQITALDIAVTERTASTADDGAFIKGTGFTGEAGKYVLVYNDTSGTGDPLYSYQVRNSVATNTSQTELPALINDVFLQGGTSSAGDFAAVIPIGANNSNGVRRIEFRNPDNSIYSEYIDNNGIFPNGANTASITRRSAAVINRFSAINLKALLEGFYDQMTNIMIQDTVLVSVRSSVSPYSVIEISKDVLASDGTGIFGFNNTADGTPYYIVIQHRNSIETWSASGISFINGSISYDFTYGASQAYGNNLVLKGSKYCVYSGDTNQDEIIDASDISSVENQVINGGSGYIPEDVNGDEFIDASDLSLVENNAGNTIFAVKPI